MAAARSDGDFHAIPALPLPLQEAEGAAFDFRAARSLRRRRA